MTGGTLSATALEWLEARGLDIELADKLGLYSQGGGSGEVLVYPGVWGGKLITTKYRPLTPQEGKPRFWRDKGTPSLAFNAEVLRDDSLIDQPLVITEGYEDAMCAIMAGFPRTISVPDGAPSSPVQDVDTSDKYAWLDPLEDFLRLDRVREVILATDGDGPGAALMHDLSLRMGRSRCRFVTYPRASDPTVLGRERLKDLNEALMAYGLRAVEQTLRRAQFIRVNGVYSLSELPPIPDRDIYEIGFDALGQHLKIRLGDMSIWTGIGGYGKSSLLNDLLSRIIQEYGVRVAWASFEQEPVTDHRRALRSWFCGDFETNLSADQLWAADAWIQEHHRFVVPNDEEDATLDWVLDRMEAAVLQHGCKICVLDPFNEIENGRAHGESDVEYINRAVRTLRRFAKRFGIHLCIVAHPTKMPRLENGTYMMPGLLDVSGGAVWRNKATQGIIVHKAEEDYVLIKVDKVKYTELLGKPGMVRAQYSQRTRRFTEVERNVIELDPDRPLRRRRS
jgi:twinkle protein